MKRQIIPLIILSIPWLGLQSKLLPEAAYRFGLDSLDQREQADYIVQNFYQIYSLGFEDAIELSQYAESLSSENNWPEINGFAWMCQGMAQYLHGQHDQALASYVKSLKLFDSLQHQEGIGRVSNEMAIFYRRQKMFKEVLECLDRSEKAARAIGNLEILGTSLHHRGTSLAQQGNYEEALPFLEEVLEIRKKQKDSVGLGYVYLDFAEIETEKGNLSKAFEFLDLSTSIRLKLNDRQGVAVNETIRGEILFANERFAEAIPYFDHAISMATDIGYVDLIRYTHDMLRQSHIQLGDFESAYASLENTMKYNDSLFNINKAQAIHDLQIKYDTEKKEQQLAVQAAQLKAMQFLLFGLGGAIILLLIIGWMYRNQLKLKHEKQLEEEKAKTREAQIEAALNSQELERKRFARDLHDGFGQLISVLNLNLKSLEHNHTNRQEVFENSEKVLEQMYRELKAICFNLMPETLIKQGLIDALREFCLRINQAGKIQVELSTFGLEDRLEDLQEISIYRITQEWINNILKYSDAGKISLNLTKDHEEITLLIEDDGSGFDKNNLLSGTGNGWKNMNSRTNLIKGELELDTTDGIRGTTLILNAPALITEEAKTSQQNENTMVTV